jgi:hypothetical protein
LDSKQVDLHLVATAHLAAGREALRLLGLSWIHTTDQELQQRIFASVIDTVVPLASHCRRLIELANMRLGVAEHHEFCVEVEIDGLSDRAELPKTLFKACGMILHSRTLRGAFAKIREKEFEGNISSAWSEAATKALVREGHGCLGVPSQNPWRYSPILKLETNNLEKRSIPAISFAQMYFDVVEPRTLKTFGTELSKWQFFDVA